MTLLLLAPLTKAFPLDLTEGLPSLRPFASVVWVTNVLEVSPFHGIALYK